MIELQLCVMQRSRSFIACPAIVRVRDATKKLFVCPQHSKSSQLKTRKASGLSFHVGEEDALHCRHLVSISWSVLDASNAGKLLHAAPYSYSYKLLVDNLLSLGLLFCCLWRANVPSHSPKSLLLQLSCSRAPEDMH